MTELTLCKLGERTRPCAMDGVVILTFIDRSWTLSVHGRPVTPSCCSAISHFARVVTPENVNDLLQYLDKLSVCPAHPDQQFIQMAKEKSFNDGRVSATIDDYANITQW